MKIALNEVAEHHFSRDNTTLMSSRQFAEMSAVVMNEPHIQDMDRVEWQAHPTLQGVVTKVFENQLHNPLVDVLIARVAVSSEIPWHVHDQANETAYVLTGQGILKYAAPDQRDNVFEAPLQAGVALTISSGWWHMVSNTGSAPLELFALHSPPTF
jgi:mannose-6-phosphate isomerase-like protein (cupin superfamily)